MSYVRGSMREADAVVAIVDASQVSHPTLCNHRSYQTLLEALFSNAACWYHSSAEFRSLLCLAPSRWALKMGWDGGALDAMRPVRRGGGLLGSVGRSRRSSNVCLGSIADLVLLQRSVDSTGAFIEHCSHMPQHWLGCTTTRKCFVSFSLRPRFAFFGSVGGGSGYFVSYCHADSCTKSVTSSWNDVRATLTMNRQRSSIRTLQ